MSDALTIGEVAERSGVATSALRFYEDKGLIQSERTSAGHRRYPRAVIRRVAFIVFAQRIGLSLEEIGDELAKPRVTCRRADWAKLGRWTNNIRERIAELQRLEAGLSECSAAAAVLDRCRLANPGDRARRRGLVPAIGSTVLGVPREARENCRTPRLGEFPLSDSVVTPIDSTRLARADGLAEVRRREDAADGCPVDAVPHVCDVQRRVTRRVDAGAGGPETRGHCQPRNIP
jgi:MerR family redox-sensitive transcriptional activator SoxR